MPDKKAVWVVVLIAIAALVPAFGQQAQKPLTNDGVVKMVQAGLAESVVIAAIQSSPAQPVTTYRPTPLLP